MIDCHMHIRAEDSSTPDKRAAWAERMRKSADALGIDRYCLIGELNATRNWGVTDPYRDPEAPRNALAELDTVRRNNEVAAKYGEEHPDLFYAWARADPRHEDAATQELRRAIEDLGMVGLKHHFRDCPVNISDPDFDPLLETLVELDAPFLPHVQQRAEPQASEEFWQPEAWSEDVVDVAERFPELKLLSAHIGGGTLWEHRIKNIAPYANVYLDLSGSNAEAGIVEMAADQLGIDRLVFGTDMAQVVNVGKLKGADLPPADKARIAYNFESLLGETVPNRLSDDERENREAAAVDRFAAAAEPRTERIVDAFAFTGGHWPFQPVASTTSGTLDLMDRKGVDRAVVSSVNSVMYRNPQNGNRELVERVGDHRDRFIPFATIDPTYPGWETDLETCVHEWDMQGVRLLPEYHNFRIADPGVTALMERCRNLDVPVMFVAALEDQRHKHDLVTLPTIDSGETWSGRQVADLIELLHDVPDTDVIIANVLPHADRIYREVCTEYGSQEQLYNRTRDGRTLFVFGGRGGMRHPDWAAELAETIGPEHLVTGPQLPFRYFEAYYSYTDHLPVSEAELDAVRAENMLELVD